MKGEPVLPVFHVSRAHGEKGAAHRKQSIYLLQEIFDEVQTEARRLGRSHSWVLQTAWRIARNILRSAPCQLQHLKDAVAKSEGKP